MTMIEKVKAVLDFFNTMIPYIIGFIVLMVIVYYLLKWWSTD